MKSTMTMGRRSFLGGVVAAALCIQSMDAAAPDHGKVPGVVIAHSPKAGRVFLGSAGIVALPDGTYLAKHDEFGPGSTEKTNAITRVYRSQDRGQSWEPVSRVEGGVRGISEEGGRGAAGGGEMMGRGRLAGAAGLSGAQ